MTQRNTTSNAVNARAVPAAAAERAIHFVLVSLVLVLVLITYGGAG